MGKITEALEPGTMFYNLIIRKHRKHEEYSTGIMGFCSYCLMRATHPENQGGPAAATLTSFSSLAHDFSYTGRKNDISYQI